MLKQFCAPTLPIRKLRWCLKVSSIALLVPVRIICRVKGLSVRTVGSMCKIFATSVYRIAHEKSYETHFGGDV